MKKEGTGEGSSIIDMLSGYIKVFSSELKTRLLSRVREESICIVVFESGITREVIT